MKRLVLMLVIIFTAFVLIGCDEFGCINIVQGVSEEDYQALEARVEELESEEYYTEEEVYAIIREYNELLVTILLNDEDNIEFYYEFGKIVEENGNPHERIYYEIDDFVNQVFENAFIDKEDITINDINIENE